MNDPGADASSANPPAWRGPLVSTGLLAASYFLLAFWGSTVLLWVPVVVGAWGIRNLGADKWYWVPLVPWIGAVVFFVYLFVVFSIGFLLS